MNEKIKSLEQQCWSHRVDGKLVDGQLHFDTQKFAELIVRECADKVHELIISDGNEFPMKSVSYRLKQHFGVEE